MAKVALPEDDQAASAEARLTKPTDPAEGASRSASTRRLIQEDIYAPPLKGAIGSTDPISTAVRLRPPVRKGSKEHFSATDPSRGLDIARSGRVSRILKNRRFQFMLIVPNQIVFWAVIFLGLLGTVVPGLNFGTAITWYVWFCLVFVMMVVVGRAWCAMCPFGGFAEWIQRKALWRRAQKALGLGKKLPEPVARYGFLLSVATFLILTFVEEFFNIAGPGAPADTAFMVLGIVSSALLFFMVFERRTFCRYFCPLSALIGTVGAMGSVAGFRTRDREVCLDCKTKDCMRGGEDGYGCPWYTWPGSADSNLACGLCTECFKACPAENIGLYLQKPMTSVVAPIRRRFDVAVGVVILWGLVVFQQFNSTNVYTSIDSWLNTHLDFPRYPNPVDYIGIIALVALITAGAVYLIARSSGASLGRGIGDGSGSSGALAHGNPGIASIRPSGSSGSLPTSSLDTSEQLVGSGGTATLVADPLPTLGSVEVPQGFLERNTLYRRFFVPIMYGMIPIVGADYFARQLPKFLKHAPRVIAAVGAWFGVGSTHSKVYGFRLLSNTGIVDVQIAVIALGTLGSLFAIWRIAGRDLVGVSNGRFGTVRLASLTLVVACGLTASVLYMIMHAAN